MINSGAQKLSCWVQRETTPSVKNLAESQSASVSRDGSVEESIYVNSAFESFGSAFTFYFCLHFKQEKTHLPPPSFCYILSAHPDVGQIDVIEDDPVAELYQPPTPRFLKEILQVVPFCVPGLCSFAVCVGLGRLTHCFQYIPDGWPLYPLQLLCQSDLPETTGDPFLFLLTCRTAYQRIISLRNGWSPQTEKHC